MLLLAICNETDVTRRPELSRLFQDMMNESNMVGFCFKALIKNTISCLKIHLLKALSLVYLINTVYFETINHVKENITRSVQFS